MGRTEADIKVRGCFCFARRKGFILLVLVEVPIRKVCGRTVLVAGSFLSVVGNRIIIELGDRDLKIDPRGNFSTFLCLPPLRQHMA